MFILLRAPAGDVIGEDAPLEFPGAAAEAVTLVLGLLRLKPAPAVGLGIAAEGDGPAGLRAARRALGRASKTGLRVPLALAGTVPTRHTEAAEAVLRLLGKLVMVRSDSEWRMLDRLTPGMRGEQRRVAAELGVSVQAVSGAVRRSGWHEEQDGRAAAALLLEQAEEVMTQWR